MEMTLSQDLGEVRFGPLAGVTVREGVAAHRQMLAGIAAHFS